MDRPGVSFGFAYGVGEHGERRWGDRYGEGMLAGRRAMPVVIAGGWASHDGPRGSNGSIDDLSFPINHGVPFCPGCDVLPPFVVFRADRMDEAGFETAAAALRMRDLFDTMPIPFRTQNGGDYAIPSMELRADRVLPDRSGFAAHLREPGGRDPEGDVG